MAVTEAELNALLAGTYGVPVGLVTGDDKVCAHAEKTLPGVVAVVVKRALGRQVAESIHPAAACDAIRLGAADAVRKAATLAPYRAEPPYAIEMDGRTTLVAELCALAPGVERIGGRTVRFTTDDFREAFRCLQAWSYLAASAP